MVLRRARETGALLDRLRYAAASPSPLHHRKLNMPHIDYWFSLVSPWAFLGHQAFLDLAKREGATVAFKPVELGEVFPHTGGLPLPKRHPARQKYRLLELQRWRELRNIPLKIHPKHWPYPVSLANRTIVALADGGADPGPYTKRCFEACWVEDQNCADEAVLAKLLTECGHNPELIIGNAGTGDIQAIYAGHAAQAVEAGVIGSPCYVLNGEVFWGQDRLDLLERALKSERAPFKTDVAM